MCLPVQGLKERWDKLLKLDRTIGFDAECQQSFSPAW